MTTGIPWRDLFALVGVIIGGLGAIAAAVIYLLSRTHRVSDDLQREYIARLVASRDETERENRKLRQEIAELRGAVRVLESMVLGRCSRFVRDAATGGCAHCDLGLAYGHKGSGEDMLRG